MDITVKKFLTFHTTDMDGVNCDVYFDGVKVGQAYDDGMCGELNFQPDYTPQVQKLVKELEDHLLTLPEFDLNADKKYHDTPMMHRTSIEDLINEAIDKALQEKTDKANKKKFEKACLTGVVIGVPKGDHYFTYSWKHVKLADMVKLPMGRNTLQAKVGLAKMELKEGETILNADYLRTLGIRV